MSLSSHGKQSLIGSQQALDIAADGGGWDQCASQGWIVGGNILRFGGQCEALDSGGTSGVESATGQD